MTAPPLAAPLPSAPRAAPGSPTCPSCSSPSSGAPATSPPRASPPPHRRRRPRPAVRGGAARPRRRRVAQAPRPDRRPVARRRHPRADPRRDLPPGDLRRRPHLRHQRGPDHQPHHDLHPARRGRRHPGPAHARLPHRRRALRRGRRPAHPGRRLHRALGRRPAHAARRPRPYRPRPGHVPDQGGPPGRLALPHHRPARLRRRRVRRHRPLPRHRRLPWATALDLGPRAWAGLLFLSVFCTLFAFFVQMWAVRRTSPSRVSLLLGTEPLWAAAAAASPWPATAPAPSASRARSSSSRAPPGAAAPPTGPGGRTGPCGPTRPTGPGRTRGRFSDHVLVALLGGSLPFAVAGAALYTGGSAAHRTADHLAEVTRPDSASA